MRRLAWLSLGFVLVGCTAESGEGPSRLDGGGSSGNTGNTGNSGNTGNTGNNGNTGGTSDAPPSTMCEPGHADCDHVSSNGCETDLSSAASCGACGHACDLAHADSACMGADGCVITGCLAGYTDCDEDPTNGCEQGTGAAGNDCSSPDSLGTISGDTGTESTSPAQATGSRWVRVRVSEDDGLNPFYSLSARIQLDVPADADYDLILWDRCGGRALASSRQSGAGRDEQLCVSWDDTFNEDDTTDLLIEVHFASGSSCDTWRLVISGNVSC